MDFRRIQPEEDLSKIIECFWTAEDTDKAPKREKIIPDGFTEIIFHFGDPYRNNLQGKWEMQSKHLLAGQINRHFFLENTGVSNILGVKMKPTALTRLYNLNMKEMTNRVADRLDMLGSEFGQVEKRVDKAGSMDERITLLSRHFKNIYPGKYISEPVDRAVSDIIEKHGMTTVSQISNVAGVGERQLENLFARYVGISPKRFARIFRFNYIFELIQQSPANWSDLAYVAAYYDQSHFIRNFRDFTGENPADYSFDEKSMANFFLRPGR